MKLIFVSYIEEVQWVQYLNFELESSSHAAQQWAHITDETWLSDCFNVLWNEVEAKSESASEFVIEAKDKSASEFMIDVWARKSRERKKDNLEAVTRINFIDQY